MNIIKIPAKTQKGSMVAKEEIKLLRVAAYCRVSTDNEEQASSYEAQIEHYTNYINQNPEWKLVRIYADDGISATSTKGREQFNAMIEDCKKGEIDMILTKSISRFTRNTVDCLNYIRMLKDINIPVYFEKENINTMDSRGEVMLTIMASLAQQESESLSKNTKMGIQYRFQQGKVMVNTTCFLGYDKDAEGNLVINPKEAEVVKRIFREYLEGKSCKKIGKGLERDGILTSRGNPRWHDTTIRKILENEKYIGDALLQKTYTIDFLNKKRGKNTGKLPQYYLEGHHEPIIPKEIYMQVQEEMARRSEKYSNSGKRSRYSANHAFTQIVFCANCGAIFKRLHWSNRGKKTIVWRCSTRLANKEACAARTIREEELQEGFLIAVREIIKNSGEYIRILNENLELAIHQANPESVENLDARMAELQHELIDRTERHENIDELAEELLRLRELRSQTVMDDAAKNEHQKRIKELQAFIRSQQKGLEFDETLVRHLLERVTVFPDNLLFTFRSGVTVTVEK